MADRVPEYVIELVKQGRCNIGCTADPEFDCTSPICYTWIIEKRIECFGDVDYIIRKSYNPFRKTSSDRVYRLGFDGNGKVETNSLESKFQKLYGLKAMGL